MDESILRFIECPDDVADVTIEDDRLVYTISIDHYHFDPSPGSRCFLATRAISTYPIFDVAREAGLRGTARLWLDDRPRGPGLAFSGSVDAILIPDTAFLLTLGHEKHRSRIYPPWRARDQAIFWRGSASGFPAEPWYALPRTAMCLDLKDESNFDVAITGGLGDTAKLQEAGVLRDRVQIEEFAEHRHTIDIDGYSATWSGLFTKLLFGCTVLKIASDQRQWYYDRLVPWQHYVPVGSIGELQSAGEQSLTHEDQCEQIAAAGRELAMSITLESAIADGVNAVARDLARAR